jgi:hypothetical protein
MGSLLLLVGGCLATPYQSAGLSGGYNHQLCEPGVYLVWFRGNGFTKAERVQQYLLYRCAEVTVESGHRYFVIITGGGTSLTTTVTTPVPGGMMVHHGVPAGTVRRAIIRVFKEKPEKYAKASDAQEVLERLRPKITEDETSSRQ